MIYVILTILLFAIMAVFPIAFSLFALRRHSSEELIIPSLLVDNPKYFTDLYRSAFKYKWASKDEDNMVNYTFKKSEKIIEADKTIEYPIICNAIVYAENYDFVPPMSITFQKEIYANKNAYLLGIKSVNGIYCKQSLHLGSGIDIVRWVDAGGEITIEDNCSMGLITSSSTRIFMGKNCMFTKMLSPQIFLGFSEGDDFKASAKTEINNEKFYNNDIVRDIKYIDDDMKDENGEIHKSVISQYDLSVIDDIKIKGDLRSHKSIRISDRAVVCGNIFAEEDIYLGEGCRVLGNVFTQGSIFFEPNVAVGQNGKIKSVIARDKIVFDKCCVVYGYIESEDICEVCLSDYTYKEDEDEE